jgi:hypothetical protein
MNRAKLIVPVVPAWARKQLMNSGDADDDGGVTDEPIYKPMRMHTVGRSVSQTLAQRTSQR